MIKIAGDTHTHTVACDHACSTLMENVSQAKKLGHSFLCMTEHGPAMPGGASLIHFGVLVNLPRVVEGVTIIRGAEVNILDYEGNTDFPEYLLQNLEWVIASFHPPCLAATTAAEHTRGWIKVAENPNLHVMGHCDRDWFEFEHLPALRAFKEHGKIVEINAESLRRDYIKSNAYNIARLCAEMEIPVVISSDAHLCLRIGAVQPAIDLLEEIGFPEQLVLNADHDRFMAYLKSMGKKID